jgi:hypothetical protein
MEHGGGDIMKKLAAILIGLAIGSFATPGFSASPYTHQTALCAAVENSQPSAWLLARLGSEFFEQKNVRTVTDSPVAVRSHFNRAKDNRIFLVSRWYDFNPQERYTFSCQWIDPDGLTYSETSASFETPESLDPGVFFTYTASLDIDNHVKEGQWTVVILLNGDLVDTRDLTIASQ